MEEAKTMKTPMSSSIKLDKDEKGMKARVLVLDCTFFPPCATVRVFFFPVHPGFWLATYGIGGPIISTIRGVKIRLDPESTYRIFYIALVGLRVYESKIWPTVPGFKPREEMDPLRVPYDDVHDLMLQEHDWSTPCGRFLTRVFKDVGVDLSRETDFKAPSSYDMYDDLSMRWMKFEKAPDEGVQFEATFSESMMFDLTYIVGPYSQPSFTKPPHTKIPPYQAPHAPDHSPWMDLSA
ncbi:hypothetical protein CK203_039091 [Vitis vinifera]|uniref:Uncharacterized protein n=1 Tax=Vitis vinifera TaxID=29760 RepID=A0A438IFP9_VITVI|nr:hypothetical protein CK203_039091 [Vitis vinifera]